MDSSQEAYNLDVPFQVSMVHRLRFTQDVFGADSQVLAELLETSGDGRARLQVWIDHNVEIAQPTLRKRIFDFAQEYSDRVELTNRPQVVPGGEEIKNDIHILERMLKVMNAADLDRRSYVLVIGGGAVLDAVGFAAAIAHRGIRLVRLPTTTLSQDDSGVGVKNGVNLFNKKNWVGAFAAPWAVVNDARLLSSLPDRDFIAGFSEAVKVALLKDPDLFAALRRDAKRIRQRDMTVANPVIRQSALLHLQHITLGGDPFESREARPLDYGHWSAHKMEALTNFELRHGEAVALGVAIDTVYSTLRHGLPEAQSQAVLQTLHDLGFDFDYPVLEQVDDLLDGLEEFRQHLGGRLTLTVLEQIGQPVDVHEIDYDAMREAIQIVSRFGGKRNGRPDSTPAIQSPQ